jgi:hypothetical protein
MNNLRTADVAEIGALAASAVPSVSGSMVKIEEMKPLSNDPRRNFVGRAHAIDENGRIRSIIVNATQSPNYDPAAPDALENSGLVREWWPPYTSPRELPVAAMARHFCPAMFRAAL